MARSTSIHGGVKRAESLSDNDVSAVPVVTEWVEWLASEAAIGWNAALTTFPTYNLYQSFEWGEYKRRSGWQVLRGSVLVDGRLEALLQGFLRTFPSVRCLVVWVPGGPAGNLAACLDLGRCLQRRFGGWFIFLRMNILEEVKELGANGWVDAGWRPAAVRVGCPSTFQLDLGHDGESRRRALTSNWRHNLRRGEQRGGQIEIWKESDPLNPVYDVYKEMCRLQRIPEAFSLDGLEAMRSSLGSACTIAVTIDGQGKLSAVRAFGKIGRRAHDLLAAVTINGRRSYANYPLMWRVLELAREQGVTIYDLSGADPDIAAGVFQFKKGLGGQMTTYAGEWDWANMACFRRVMNWVLRFRRTLV